MSRTKTDQNPASLFLVRTAVVPGKIPGTVVASKFLASHDPKDALDIITLMRTTKRQRP